MCESVRVNCQNYVCMWSSHTLETVLLGHFLTSIHFYYKHVSTKCVLCWHVRPCPDKCLVSKSLVHICFLVFLITGINFICLPSLEMKEARRNGSCCVPPVKSGRSWPSPSGAASRATSDRCSRCSMMNFYQTSYRWSLLKCVVSNLVY